MKRNPPVRDSRVEWIEHGDPETWIHGIVADMERMLAVELAIRGRARMLLSGGTTPAPAYAQLAVAPLDWSKITVGLVDERWLSPQDSASNARLVRESLLDRADVAAGQDSGPASIMSRTWRKKISVRDRRIRTKSIFSNLSCRPCTPRGDRR